MAVVVSKEVRNHTPLWKRIVSLWWYQSAGHKQAKHISHIHTQGFNQKRIDYGWAGDTTCVCVCIDRSIEPKWARPAKAIIFVCLFDENDYYHYIALLLLFFRVLLCAFNVWHCCCCCGWHFNIHLQSFYVFSSLNFIEEGEKKEENHSQTPQKRSQASVRRGKRRISTSKRRKKNRKKNRNQSTKHSKKKRKVTMQKK